MSKLPPVSFKTIPGIDGKVVVAEIDFDAVPTTDAEKLELARKVLRLHADCLGAWLTDNTIEVFEEEPEVDDARGDMEECLRLIGEPS